MAGRGFLPTPSLLLIATVHLAYGSCEGWGPPHRNMGGRCVLSCFLPSRVEKSHRWGASWATSALRAPVCCAMERLCDWSLTVEKGGGIFEGPTSVSDENQFKAV